MPFISELSEFNIERLNNIRLIINEYSSEKLNNSSTNKLIVECNFKLASFDFINILEAKKFNLIMNVLEFDRCYRIRPLNKQTIATDTIVVDDFCINGSGCINNNKITCAFDLEFISCVKMERIYSNILPNEKSLFSKEYINKGIELGLNPDDLFIPHPLLALSCGRINPDTHTPDNCIGKCLKIDEPRFNLYWGMERYFDAVDVQRQLRNNLS